MTTEAPFQKHSETSKAAATEIRARLPNLQQLVFNAIASAGVEGLTDEEISERTGLNPSTARPRRLELYRKGRIQQSIFTRNGASGRKMTVWIPVFTPDSQRSSPMPQPFSGVLDAVD